MPWVSVDLRPLAGDRSHSLEGSAEDLGWINDAGSKHFDVLLGLGVEAEDRRGIGLVLLYHGRAFDARIRSDLANRNF